MFIIQFSCDTDFLSCTVLFKFFIQFIKFTLHLQFLQNIGSIPCVVQYILVAYLTPSSLYLPLPTPVLPLLALHLE